MFLYVGSGNIPNFQVTERQVSDITLKPNDSTQQTDISVNEVLIPAKSDVTVSSGNEGSVAVLNSENMVIALGEAVCFQYMNASGCLPPSDEMSDCNQTQTDTNAVGILMYFMENIVFFVPKLQQKTLPHGR